MDRQQYIAGMAVLFLSIMLIGSLVVATWPAGEITNIGLEKLGLTTFETYGITFIIVGLVMFAAMLGGIFMAREDEEQ